MPHAARPGEVLGGREREIEMLKDPIVEEVHVARKRIDAECGHDVRKIFERERQGIKECKGKVVTKEELARRRRKATGKR